LLPVSSRVTKQNSSNTIVRCALYSKKTRQNSYIALSKLCHATMPAWDAEVASLLGVGVHTSSPEWPVRNGFFSKVDNSNDSNGTNYQILFHIQKRGHIRCLTLAIQVGRSPCIIMRQRRRTVVDQMEIGTSSVPAIADSSVR
jgi:hypothetical protein